MFDDRLMRELSARLCDLPPWADSAKVRKGVAGEHRHELSAETVGRFDEQWRQEVTRVTGFVDYEAFRAAVAER